MYKTAHHTRDTTYTAMKKHEYEEGALKQDARTLAHFKTNPGKSFTAEDIHRLVLPNAPLTSARRSLSNLTSAGYLIKQEAKKIEGSYGRDICTWRYNVQYTQAKLFD